MKLPISFVEKVKQPASQNKTGYPYRISAGDLDRNFEYAALDAEDGYIEEISGAGDNKGRKLLLPPIPPSGMHGMITSEGTLVYLEFLTLDVTKNGYLARRDFLCTEAVEVE
jgi:hypothetical protein